MKKEAVDAGIDFTVSKDEHGYLAEGSTENFAIVSASGELWVPGFERTLKGVTASRIMELADAANPFVEHARPWDLKKDPARQDELRDVCTVALNLFRQLAIYLAPVLPQLADRCGEFLGDPIVDCQQSQTPLLGKTVKPFQRMMDRVQIEDLQKMIEESREQSDVDGRQQARPDVAPGAVAPEGPSFRSGRHVDVFERREPRVMTC
jgi:hypothetical protein